MKAECFETLAAHRAAGRSCALVTRLADGAQTLVEQDGVRGDVVLTDAQLAEVADLLRAGDSAPLSSDEGLFARTYAAPPRLLVVGAVHISQFLAAMATMAGYQVTVIDPRRAFASGERFPGVALTDDWPDEAMARLAPDDRTAVVTLAHDPKLDDPALAAALRSPAFYVGALGSRRTHAKRVERLAAEGVGDQLGRIRAPVGLDIGGRSPAEIAVSILAQIIQARYRGVP
ncbi:MAG: XdhC family protein [Rhodocyclaceae bacterium]|nr:XdhC family protein [Rhodocyclaceae bacterium]